MMKLNLIMLPAIMLVAQLTLQAPSPVMPPIVARQMRRLCGHSFKLVLVSTCGGSRWKRMSVEDEIQMPVLDSANELVQSDNNRVLKTVKLESAQDPDLKQSQSPTGSDFPRVKYPQRKRETPNDLTQLAEKCCQERCTYDEIAAHC
ncbi:uncharacterized protein LOC143841132 [Paroedura picta]|uniref:uncharacterized protein LOC143841132 n=1 Tax=Paroedura picta TaxID=143630 RepID=UPI004056CC8C